MNQPFIYREHDNQPKPLWANFAYKADALVHARTIGGGSF
jgi:hypothetical protein